MIPNNAHILALALHPDKTVADMAIGQTATIVRLSDGELSLKLLEMGCLPGETLLLQHIAPLGDPVCIRVSGYNLSLRKAEAATILVRVMDSDADNGVAANPIVSILSKPITVA